MLPPLRFEPLIKRRRWGGVRLRNVLGKLTGDVDGAAESWEIVDYGADQSVVVDGEWKGYSLKELLAKFPQELLGCHVGMAPFPLLVKFLDVHDRLSVQVHPGDVQARKRGLGPYGKSEAWIVLEAAPGSVVHAGFREGIARADVEWAMAHGKLVPCLNAITVKPGDCLFIPTGTVHAVSDGVLLLEIQQTCDVTFRLYDWGRLDRDGKARPLQQTDALECLDFTHGPRFPQVPKPIDSTGLSEELLACSHFVVRRHQVPHPREFQNDYRFRIFSVVGGGVTLQAGKKAFPLLKGQTVLLPACQSEWTFLPGDPKASTVIEACLP